MTPVLLVQVDGLSETQRAVRDRFQEGGSVTVVLLVLVALVAVVFCVHYLTQRQRREDRAARRADPQRLFQDLLHKLDLAPPQRRLLGTVAKDLRLKQPAVILLSPVLFERYLQEWQARQRRVSADAGELPQSELIAHTRGVLFPWTS